MIASVVDTILIGLAVALPGFILGYLGWWQSRKVDSVAAQAGIETLEQGTISQVISSLNQLNDALQKDNEVLRTNVSHLNEKLDKIIQQCEELKNEIIELNKKVPQNAH